jgi:small conductance mechanosensitive channel
MILAGFVLVANAQEPRNSAEPDTEKREAVIAELTERSLLIDRELATIARLESDLPADEVMATVYQARIDAAKSDLFRELLDLADDVIEQREQGINVEQFTDELARDLDGMAEQINAQVTRIGERLSMPSPDLPAAEQAIANQQMAQLFEQLDKLYAVMLSYTEVAASFDLDPSPQDATLRGWVQEEAADRSAILELAIKQASIAGGAAETVPDDTNLAGLKAAADARVSILISALEDSVSLLNKLDIDSAHYRQQLVSVTGEVTADALDLGVIRGILGDWRDTATDFVSDDAPGVLFNIVIFVLIVVAASYVGKLVSMGLTKLFSSSPVHLSNLAETMITKTARNAILFVGVLIALSQLGVSLGPVLAGLGIAGFIVGFALQDTLSNFASGVLILIYRPFDIGDYVSAGGVTGRVGNMSLVNTTFKTPDNETLIVPNNKVWQDVIKNTTAQHTRRVDLTFGISYSDDIDRAREILLDVAQKYDAVLAEPPTDVRVNELADSSVNLLLRPWVRTSDYWDTYWDLMELVKKRFDAEGITIPFPQRDIHNVHAEDPPVPATQKVASYRDETIAESGTTKHRAADGQDLAIVTDEDDDS